MLIVHTRKHLSNDNNPSQFDGVLLDYGNDSDGGPTIHLTNVLQTTS